MTLQCLCEHHQYSPAFVGWAFVKIDERVGGQWLGEVAKMFLATPVA